MGRENRCFFTGHRIIASSQFPIIRTRLKCEIENMLSNNIKTFICGGAMGFDTLAAQEVIFAREQDENVKLILALPCRNQTEKWRRQKDIDNYNEILSLADHRVYVSDVYKKGCMYKRNRYMADHALHCIAYRTHYHGGSDYTVKYAQEIGCEIVFVADVAKQGCFLTK